MPWQPLPDWVCMFCGKNDSPPSEEDVFAKWIARLFPDHKRQRFRINGASGQDPLRPIMPDTQGKLGLITMGPCRRCNNEWMSVLEEEASIVMKPLIGGQSAALSMADRITITRWAVKTAMTFDFMEHTERGEPLYFCQEYRSGMCVDQGFPPLTTVFALRYAGDYALTATAGTIVLRFTADDGAEPFDGQAYSMTITMGQLGIQLITIDGQKEFGRRANIFAPVPRGLVTSSTQVFPVVGETAVWPKTNVAFRDEHIRTLSNRTRQPATPPASE